jgi:hypothetical protein
MDPPAKGFGVPQAIDPDERVDERVLHDVFGIAGRTEQPVSEAPNTGLVPPDELREGTVFTGPHRSDEVGVLYASS